MNSGIFRPAFVRAQQYAAIADAIGKILAKFY